MIYLLKINTEKYLLKYFYRQYSVRDRKMYVNVL